LHGVDVSMLFYVVLVSVTVIAGHKTAIGRIHVFYSFHTGETITFILFLEIHKL